MGVPSKQPTNYFYKTLIVIDTSTYGGLFVPHKAANKVFPPLNFSLQPPALELIARDLHEVEWKFRHIFRGIVIYFRNKFLVVLSILEAMIPSLEYPIHQQ
ncbi:Auxin response factor 8 [Platanthera zijinensis]|uniref:Auxin response factor 8 n=1 Tax=Platanthera zijinensis TaxID=2320716 RepID=A0AAP0G056_9ASPA